MVDLKMENGQVLLEVRGWSRVLTLKHRLQFPYVAVRDIHRAGPDLVRRLGRGLRLMGINLPGVLTAGTFHHRRHYSFWDVRNPSRAVVVELAGERYFQLVVEVENPDATIREMRSALRALSWNT